VKKETEASLFAKVTALDLYLCRRLEERLDRDDKIREFNAARRDRRGCRHVPLNDPRLTASVLSVIRQLPPKP